jgi:hypothetical protein
VAAKSPVAERIFITGYQLGCQADVFQWLGHGGSGAGGGNAGVGAPVINPVAVG